VSVGRDRGGAKWDRAARYLKIVTILHEHRDGIAAQAIANFIGVSKRTVYRDLLAMQLDADLPIWAEGGKWGLEPGAFLPPLALTLHEATTLFLAARVLAKATDEHDPELIGTLLKLAQVLPPVLAEHIAQTMDAFALTPRNERFTRGPAGGWSRSTTTPASTTRHAGFATHGSSRGPSSPRR
jgi:predicted DNA-binding transcriptional regulator YafY